MQPKYRVELHQHLPVLGWKRIAAISGKVDVPGLIRFRLDNPGAPLPEVGIRYEIIPGVPNILNIPDWAETSFKPDGQTIRDKIRELLTRQELIRPFSRFAGAALCSRCGSRNSPCPPTRPACGLTSPSWRRWNTEITGSRESIHVRIRSHRQQASIAKMKSGSQAASDGTSTAVLPRYWQRSTSP